MKVPTHLVGLFYCPLFLKFDQNHDKYHHFQNLRKFKNPVIKNDDEGREESGNKNDQCNTETIIKNGGVLKFRVTPSL